MAGYATETVVAPSDLTDEERDAALDLLGRPRPDGGWSAVARRRDGAHLAHWVSAPVADGDAWWARLVRALLRGGSYFACSPLAFCRRNHSCCLTLALSVLDSLKQEGRDEGRSPLNNLAWLALLMITMITGRT